MSNRRSTTSHDSERFTALPPLYVPHSTTTPGTSRFSNLVMINNCSSSPLAEVTAFRFRRKRLNRLSFCGTVPCLALMSRRTSVEDAGSKFINRRGACEIASKQDGLQRLDPVRGYSSHSVNLTAGYT